MKKIDKLLRGCLVAVAALVGFAASAQLQPVPPNISTAAPRPMIMLNMSRDHQLFYRAYDEYSDIDGDGAPETTYKHSINYYGYFDSSKCYSYVNNLFVPVALVDKDNYCSGTWSGNLLNWATMTRMDVLRKALYGGFRYTDTAAATVLERASLPTDAHSFAKFFEGADLDRLTPFNGAALAPTRSRSNDDVLHKIQYDVASNGQYVYQGSPPSGAPTGSCAALAASAMTAVPTDYNCVWFKTGSGFNASFTPEIGDQVRAVFDANTNGAVDAGETSFIAGQVIGVDNGQNFTLLVAPDGFNSSTPAARKSWVFSILSQASVTFCNTTVSAAAAFSQSNTASAPLLRVARGDHQLWNANERWQCYWSEEKSAQNGNNVSITGLNSSSSNPSRLARGLTAGASGPDFNVRVKVCDAALLGSERCQQYPDGNYKPIGLLQEYGERDLAEFALLTGSYTNNTRGGVLRSNMQSFRNEVNYTTNGTFVGSARGVVYNLDRLRIYGYSYLDGTYVLDGNCTFQLTGLGLNQCASWGNPLGEMFSEALRYLGGLRPTAAFTYSNLISKDAEMGLSQPAWVDPFLRSSPAERVTVEKTFGKAQCRRIDVLNFNASVTSYDHDELSGFQSLAGSPSSAGALTDVIGADEQINGKAWFIGDNGSVNDRTCTGKTIAGLGGVKGVCPDGPGYSGSYGIAGIAYWAHTHPIRADINPGSNADKAFRVKTWGVSLAPGKPRIVIADPSDPAKKIVIQPSYQLRKPDGGIGSGTLVDFRIISQTPTDGKYLVIWEDSEQGGDYDQDASGILRYEVRNGKLHVYTRTFAAATDNPQGFGYTISGTNKDGVHFHSGIINFDFNDPTNLTVVQQNADGSTQTTSRVNASGGCSGCQVNDPETRATYDFGVSTAGVLQEPMWYAAKWGGFTDGDPPTGKPDAVTKWDNKHVDGSAGADGTPDNYFLAYRADQLELALRAVLQDIVNVTDAAPAVSSSQISEQSMKYAASFSGVDGHGELVAYKANADGTFPTTALWRADKLLTDAFASRQVISNVGPTGAPLTWAALPNSVKTATFGALTTQAQQDQAEARLLWIRGDRSNEVGRAGSYGFRARNKDSVLGSVINSNPHFQRRPGAAFLGTVGTGYPTFRTAQASRKQVLWLGANDGMLHGFDAQTGDPLLSYLPQPLLKRAAEWSDPSSDTLMALMDGSPFTGDVKVGSQWATYLFATLGRGGRGVFALDVTQPGQFNEGNAASIFKWQFGPSDDADIGYVLSEGEAINPSSFQPGQIARMANGQFAVLFGNGYKSPAGKAVLYILFVDGPNAGNWSGRFVKLTADAVGPNNGLSQPMWADVDNDGVADFIYAGDLKGNLWKFDVQSTDPTKWAAAYNGLPLFVAKNSDATSQTLPITSVPRYVYHPFGGTLITFATGKAVQDGDFPDATRQQAIFGIWDKIAYAQAPVAALPSLLPRLLSSLATRTYVVNASDQAYLQGESIDWNSKAGWYVKLVESGEAVVTNPSEVGDLMVFTSIVPNVSSQDCFSGPKVYLNFMNALTGLLDVNVAGTVDVSAVEQYMLNRTETSGKTTFAQCAGAQCAIPAKCTGTGCVNNVCTGPNCQMIRGCDRPIMSMTNSGEGPRFCSVGDSSRLSWREVPAFRTGN